MKTNKDYIIAAMTGEIDDGGAALESVLFYNIQCPYRTDLDKGKCVEEKIGNVTREDCAECKEKWLESEHEE